MAPSPNTLRNPTTPAPSPAAIRLSENMAQDRVLSATKLQIGTQENDQKLLSLLRRKTTRKQSVAAILGTISVPEFDLQHLTPDYITELEKQSLALAEKLSYSRERERTNLFAGIEREYDLLPADKTELTKTIANLSDRDLNSHNNTLGRRSLLKNTASIRVLPILRSRAKQLEQLIGASDWSKLVPTDKTTLVTAYEWRNSDPTKLIRVIWSLSQRAQVRCMDEMFGEMTLNELYALASTWITPQFFVDDAKKSLSDKITQEQKSLLIVDRATAIEIQEIVDGLDWEDIKSSRLSSSDIGDIATWKKVNLIIDRTVANRFKRSIRASVAKSRALYEEEEDGPVENISPQEQQERYYQAAQKFDADGVRALEDSLLSAGILLSGADTLLNSSFQSGATALIIQTTRKNGSIQCLRARAVRNGLNATQKAPLAIELQWIGDVVPGTSLVFDFESSRSQELVSTLQTSIMSNTPAKKPESITLMSEAEFKASLLDTWAYSIAEYDRLDAEAQERDRLAAQNREQAAAGENLNSAVETTEAVAEDTGITSLADFQTAIGAMSERSEGIVGVGSTMTLGKYGVKGFNIFKVHKINPERGIQFTDGDGGLEPGWEEYFSFNDLYENLFKKRGSTARFRSQKFESAADILSFMQSESKGDAWGRIKIQGEAGKEFFDFSDREFDKEKVAKKYFSGPNGSIIEIESIENGQIVARLGGNFEPPKKGSKPDASYTATWYEEPRIYSAQYIAAYLLRTGAEPWNMPPGSIESREVTDATKPGTVRSIMGRLSFHDIMSGGKKFFEEFKHHLEHGNHLQEQRVMLSIAKRTGMHNWNPEWYYDFKSKYESEEKKLIEERVDTLSKMATPDRQRSIRNSLLTDGTHDYDHWTNAVAMLKKHGNLYAGELQDLDGTWIFFKRIANIPLKANVKDYSVFKKIVDQIRAKGIDNITEEAVIEEYMKTDSHFPNSQIWKMVKWNLATGISEEMSNGEKEVEALLTIDQRVYYAMGKLRGKEYWHGIGAFKYLLTKWGSNKKKHSIAFMLAMSRIPERLPRDVLNTLNNMFDEWRIHSPALSFIKDRSSQSLFRDTVGELVKLKIAKYQASGDTYHAEDMEKKFKKMKEAIGVNQDVPWADGKITAVSYDAIKEFWDDYGDYLQTELTVNIRGDQFMTSASLRHKHPALEQYHSRMVKQFGDSNITKDDEAENGTLFMLDENGASPLMLVPEKVLDKIGLLNSHGQVETDRFKRGQHDDFFSALDHIRGEQRDENGVITSMSREDQKDYFKKLYIAFCNKMKDANLKSWNETDLGKAFNSIGLTPPPAISQREYAAEQARIRIPMSTVTLELGTKEAALKKALSDPTHNGLNDSALSTLNQRVDELREEKREYEQQLNTMRSSMQGGAARFNDADPDQRVHFERCFTQFYSNTTAEWLRAYTEGRAMDALAAGDEAISGPTSNTFESSVDTD